MTSAALINQKMDQPKEQGSKRILEETHSIPLWPGSRPWHRWKNYPGTVGKPLCRWQNAQGFFSSRRRSNLRAHPRFSRHALGLQVGPPIISAFNCHNRRYSSCMSFGGMQLAHAVQPLSCAPPLLMVPPTLLTLPNSIVSWHSLLYITYVLVISMLLLKSAWWMNWSDQEKKQKKLMASVGILSDSSSGVHSFLDHSSIFLILLRSDFCPAISHLPIFHFFRTLCSRLSTVASSLLLCLPCTLSLFQKSSWFTLHTIRFIRFHLLSLRIIMTINSFLSQSIQLTPSDIFFR